MQINTDKVTLDTPDGKDELTITVATPMGQQSMTVQRMGILLLAQFITDKLKEMQGRETS